MDDFRVTRLATPDERRRSPRLVRRSRATAGDLGINVRALVDAFNRLAQSARTSTGKKAECIEWADLGSISTGAWRNGNGRVTRGFKAGDLGRAHDRPELVKNYEASHQHCLDMNENTMKQAIVDMVIIGRKVTDVDNEKRQIRDYFQSKVRECQAEFTRRFRKYEDKFCG